MMRRFIFLFLLIAFVLSCKRGGDSKDILEPEKMQEVYWDYLRADVYSKEFIIKDSGKNDTLENLKLQDKVFQLHQVSREKFYRSFDYYINHRELLQAIIDTMLVRQKPENKIFFNPGRDSFNKFRANFFYQYRLYDSIKKVQ